MANKGELAVSHGHVSVQRLQALLSIVTPRVEQYLEAQLQDGYRRFHTKVQSRLSELQAHNDRNWWQRLMCKKWPFHTHDLTPPETPDMPSCSFFGKWPECNAAARCCCDVVYLNWTDREEGGHARCKFAELQKLAQVVHSGYVSLTVEDATLLAKWLDKSGDWGTSVERNSRLDDAL